MAGSGSTAGQPVQLSSALRSSCWLPFAPTSVLVLDRGNGRVVEVNVVTGSLVKVWSAAGSHNSVAASLFLVAIAQGSQVDLYDPTGSIVRSIVAGSGGVVFDTVWGMRFSVDGAYVVFVDQGATSVGMARKFRSSDGTPVAVSGNTLGTFLTDVEECVSSLTNNVALAMTSDVPGTVSVVDGSSTTQWPGPLDRALGLRLLPGVGTVVAEFNTGRLVLLSSVALATHPISTTVLATTPVTFSVTLSPNSATSGITYTWTKGGIVVASGNFPNLFLETTINDADAGPSYAIVCTVSHALGLAVSNTATLTALRPITVSPAATTVVVGASPFTFTATLGPGPPALSYTWTLNGVVVGGDSPTYVYTAVDAHGGQVLSVMCAKGITFGAISSNIAMLTVQVSPASMRAMRAMRDA